MLEAGAERRADDGEVWRVLVADSAPGTRRQLAATLRAFDPTIEVIEAETGRGALEAILTRAPDLAFVSLQLPEMTGAETLAFARARGAKLMAVLMSSQVLPKWVDLSTELEAYEFLKKPFDPAHVLLMLEAIRRMRRPARLLLVDESPSARTLVQRVLQASRFRLDVDETDTGRHALKLLQIAPYDLALIDLNLSGMDGLEAACQAREVAPDTRLLLMSAIENATVAQAARHFGVSGFLRKPFYARDVDNALHATFGLRRPYLLNALMPRPAPKSRVAAR